MLVAYPWATVEARRGPATKKVIALPTDATTPLKLSVPRACISVTFRASEGGRGEEGSRARRGEEVEHRQRLDSRPRSPPRSTCARCRLLSAGAVRVPACAALAAALALALSLPAAADYESDYAEGLKAAGDGKWAEAESKMKAALAAEADAGAAHEHLRPQLRRLRAAILHRHRGVPPRRLRRRGAQPRHRPDQGRVSDSKAKSTRLQLAPRSRTKGLSMPDQAGIGDRTDAADGLDAAARHRGATPPPTQPIASTPAAVVEGADDGADPDARARPRRRSSSRRAAPGDEGARSAEARGTRGTAAPSRARSTTTCAAATQQVAAVDTRDAGRQEGALPPAAAAAPRRATLAQIQGDAGAPLVAQAEADIRAGEGELDPARSPDESLFWPRFRALYSATR